MIQGHETDDLDSFLKESGLSANEVNTHLEYPRNPVDLDLTQELSYAEIHQLFEEDQEETMTVSLAITHPSLSTSDESQTSALDISVSFGALTRKGIRCSTKEINEKAKDRFRDRRCQGCKQGEAEDIQRTLL